MHFELYFEYFARHLHLYFTVTKPRRIAAVAIFFLDVFLFSGIYIDRNLAQAS